MPADESRASCRLKRASGRLSAFTRKWPARPLPCERRMREAIKTVVHAAAWLAVTPSVISFRVRARIMGADRAIEGSTQAWALIPGLAGQYLRRAFLCRTLKACARTALIEFGTLFSSASATIGERAYVGPRCHLGWALI